MFFSSLSAARLLGQNAIFKLSARKVFIIFCCVQNDDVNTIFDVFAERAHDFNGHLYGSTLTTYHLYRRDKDLLLSRALSLSPSRLVFLVVSSNNRFLLADSLNLR